METKRLFLLDAYALIYRAYYALIRAPRITSKGFNTSAIFGFCNTLDEILRKENPSHIAVCFDPKGGMTFRHEVYPEYKAQRDAQPEDITLSIPYIKRIINAYNIPIIEMERYEADDIIGTLAKRAAEEGYTTFMMTPDKDYGQLVTDNILMYRPSLRGRDFEIRGVKEVCERYGIDSPRQVIDLLALEGDASDNIPGCPGVGEKTASKLIKEFGSVENLIGNVGQLKGALKKKIEENSEKIMFSKYLVTIKTDVPVEVTISSLIRKPENIESLRDIYAELEFKTFLSRLNSRLTPLSDTPQLPGVETRQDADTAEPQPLSEEKLFDDGPDAGKIAPENVPAIDRNVTVIANSLEEVGKIVEETVRAGKAGIATYAVGAEAMTAKFKGIAVAIDNDRVFYLPVPVAADKLKRWSEIMEPLFISPDITIVSHDVKRDMILLRRLGIEFSAHYTDTSVAHYLLQPEMRHSLSQVAMSYLGYQTIDYDDPAVTRKPYGPINGDVSAEAIRTGEASRIVLLLEPVLRKLLEENGATMLMEEIELPLIEVLASMEWTGARIDIDELSSLSRQLTDRLHTLEKEAFELSGEEFNLSSPMKVGEILFDKLKIDAKAKKTKTGAYSTSEEILEKLKSAHPIVDIILKYRALKKLLTTYINALPELINPQTGKIHTTYNQTVTATGRISSANPNLQNIPVRTEDGREIRRAFIADPGDIFLSADYSQIELRLLANLSKDPDMTDAFKSGRDFHAATASKIYHIPIEEVTADQRRNAKTANFGIVYGISAFGLSERLGIPRAEAKQLIDSYYATYPGVQRYIVNSIAHAKLDGYVETVMGRKRYLPDINSRNAVVRGYAERNAVNAPLQGSAADIIKRAMIDIYRDIRDKGLKTRMIMQVHDELIFNVKPDELPEIQKIVETRMSGAFNGNVPLEVSAGVGQNWLEAH